MQIHEGQLPQNQDCTSKASKSKDRRAPSLKRQRKSAPERHAAYNDTMSHKFMLWWRTKMGETIVWWTSQSKWLEVVCFELSLEASLATSTTENGWGQGCKYWSCGHPNLGFIWTLIHSVLNQKLRDFVARPAPGPINECYYQLENAKFPQPEVVIQRSISTSAILKESKVRAAES